MHTFQTFLFSFKFNNDIVQSFKEFDKFIDLLCQGKEFLNILGEKLKGQYSKAYERGEINSTDNIKISSLVSDIRIYPLITKAIKTKKVVSDVIDLLYNHHKEKPRPDHHGDKNPNFCFANFTEVLNKKEQITQLINRKDNSYFVCKMKLDKDNVIKCFLSNLDDEYYFCLYDYRNTLDALTHQCSEGYWEYDMENNSMFTNERLWESMGYDMKEDNMKPTDWRKVIYPEDLKRADKLMAEHLEGKADYRLTVRYKKKDGNPIWIDCRGSKLLHPVTYKPYKLVGVHTDVTEKQVLMEKLDEMNKNKNKYISKLAHELKNILNMISGNSQLIDLNLEMKLDKNRIQKIKKYNSSVLSSVKVMSKMITDISNIKRAEQNVLEINTEKTDVHKIHIEALESHKKAMLEKKIKLITNLSKTPIILNIDPLRYRQCVINILNNAIKYNRENGCISLAEKVNKNKFRLSIEDNGIGIDKKDLKNIFVPFTRLQPRYAPGSGLGLALTKSLIENMNGQILITSKGLNRGTTIDIVFSISE